MGIPLYLPLSGYLCISHCQDTSVSPTVRIPLYLPLSGYLCISHYQDTSVSPTIKIPLYLPLSGYLCISHCQDTSVSPSTPTCSSHYSHLFLPLLPSSSSLYFIKKYRYFIKS